MADTSSNQFSGGLSYQAPIFQLGMSSGTVGGGFNFDLPLATIAAFNNQALNFLSQNTANNQGFLSGVINSQSNQVNSLANQSFNFSNTIAQLAATLNQRTTEALGQISANNVAIAAAQSQANAQIAANSGGGFCFITTAVCEFFHLGDDCEELKTLRDFRDNYLAKTNQGKAEIAMYYAIAPQIVEKIKHKDNKGQIYARMLSDYLFPAIDAIKTGDNEKAHNIYKKLCLYATLESMD